MLRLLIGQACRPGRPAASAARRNLATPMVLGREHNSRMPRRNQHSTRRRWPLAAGLAAGVALDALFGDPRRGHPVAAFGRAATVLEDRDYADSRPRGAAHAAACVLAVALPAALADRATRGRPLAHGRRGVCGVGGHRCPFATS